LLAQNCSAQNKTNTAVYLDSIPFVQFTGGVIVFEAKIGNNSTPLHFILDTGSGGASIDSVTAQELNLVLIPTDTIVNGIAGAHKVSYIFNQKFTTGNLVTDSMNFYVNDYSILSSVYGDKIDGIIGYNFLSRYIFNINFDSSKIFVYSKGKYKYQQGGVLLRPTFSKLMHHPLDLKDKKKTTDNIYFDTGAGLNILLTESFIKDNDFLLSRRKPLVTQVQGLGGKKKMRLTVIRKLKVGPYVFRQVPVNLYSDDAEIINYPNVVGLLGNDILRRFNITLNYAAQEMHIIPNRNYGDGFDYAYTGLSLYNFEGKIFIDDIIKDSPAEKAKLKNGDQVVAIETNFSGDIRLYEKLLQKAKESIKIIVNRNEKILLLELKPLSIR
jgi:Aspartyl protease